MSVSISATNGDGCSYTAEFLCETQTCMCCCHTGMREPAKLHKSTSPTTGEYDTDLLMLHGSVAARASLGNCRCSNNRLCLLCISLLDNGPSSSQCGFDSPGLGCPDCFSRPVRLLLALPHKQVWCLYLCNRSIRIFDLRRCWTLSAS